MSSNGAVAAIAKEAVLAPIGDVEIVEAVAVDVADARALAPAGLTEARAIGDVFERAITLVAIEVRRRPSPAPRFAGAAVVSSSVVPFTMKMSRRPSRS